MAKPEPPNRIELRWCPECGRDDRFRPFTGKSHFIRGERCPGKPVTIGYVLWEDNRLAT